RVVELIVAARPSGPADHVAIVPNLVPLERQLEALQILELATDDSRVAPLRVLAGLAPASILPALAPRTDLSTVDKLDEHQSACASGGAYGRCFRSPTSSSPGSTTASRVTRRSRPRSSPPRPSSAGRRSASSPATP